MVFFSADLYIFCVFQLSIAGFFCQDAKDLLAILYLFNYSGI